MLKRTVYFLCVLPAKNANTCTDFMIKAQDGTRIVGRSMEFAALMTSLAIVHPRGEVFKAVRRAAKPELHGPASSASSASRRWVRMASTTV
jgi:penicillin V acylase-like amidase (Ntn superfamily)